ncbi:MAG: class I SAM-dependent methyltransferase [Bacteroidetes bacterium]|nr:class I SAM-dependent methyltransferase [Bacteroidota bacterium]
MSFNRVVTSVLPEYELLDSGDFEKLERFGKYILRRPEPQAIWSKSLPEREWEKQCHAVFTRKNDRDAESGNWQLKTGMPDRWQVQYKNGLLHFRMRLALTSFKHVGIFPEQAENWDYIARSVSAIQSVQPQKPRVLNLFAYTGGASLAACQAGADVTHVDSVKPVVSWSRENMESSGLDGIRWVVEDAFKFVQREVKRGKTYHGIILDPPAYGRGPDGEKWVLEKQINELLGLCAQLLEGKNAFLLINLYSMGFSPLITENLIQDHFPGQKFDSGELILNDRSGRGLPTGTFVRFVR